MIRDQAKRKVSTRKIAKELGWDMAQLERIARKHDIRLVTAPVTKKDLDHERSARAERPDSVNDRQGFKKGR
jgi:hypothetical protein